MEELIVTQGPRTRPGAVQDALNAYQTAAWRTPGVSRFDSRPANDFLSRAEAVTPRTFAVEPAMARRCRAGWSSPSARVIAALMGALLGGMLAV